MALHTMHQWVTLCACLLAICLQQSAAVLPSSRPGNVLILLLTDCAKYQDWQTIAAVYAWRQSKQAGSLVRVANCNEQDSKSYDPRMLDYVQTHMAPQFAFNKELNDWYAAYNKPGAVLDFFKHHDPKEEYMVVLDSDMLLRKPFEPDQLNVTRGWALAAHYDYLKGVDNDLAMRHVPYLKPRNDTSAGAVGRRGDRVGGPYYMHKDDLRRLAPAWLNWTRIMRTDMEAYKDSGDTAATKPGDRIWIAEMYGYAFGAANLDIWHHWAHDFMLYPSYTPAHVPHVVHYGLVYHVNDWSFDKHWYFHFDAHKCPPWDLTKERPDAGIFPPPPAPELLSQKDFLSHYKDLLSVWVVSLVNAALCDYHVRNCPYSRQLHQVCNKAFAHHFAIEQDLKKHESQWDCVDHNKECNMWFKRGECKKSDAYMKEHCALSCKLCTPQSPTPKEPEDLQPVTVEALIKELGGIIPDLADSNDTAASSDAAATSPAAASATPEAGYHAGPTDKPLAEQGGDVPEGASSAAVGPADVSVAPLEKAAAAAELAKLKMGVQGQPADGALAASGGRREDPAIMLKLYPSSTAGYAALVQRCTRLAGLNEQQLRDCVKAASFKLEYPGVLKTGPGSAGSTLSKAAGGQSAEAATDLAMLHARHHADLHLIEDMLSKRMTGTRGGLTVLEQLLAVAVVAGVAWWGHHKLQKYRHARAKAAHNRSD